MYSYKYSIVKTYIWFSEKSKKSGGLGELNSLPEVSNSKTNNLWPLKDHINIYMCMCVGGGGGCMDV